MLLLAANVLHNVTRVDDVQRSGELDMKAIVKQ